MNALNGFEVLNTLAFDAYEYAADHNMNVQVYDIDGYNDLYAIKEVLNAIGWDIGLISDDNVTKLEPLGNVISISSDYQNSQFDNSDLEEGENAVEAQTGFFKTIDGMLHKAADIFAIIIKKFTN